MNEEEKPFAVITGASSGIGEAFARGFAVMGFNLIIIARRENKLQELAVELQKKHEIAVLTIKADLSKIEEIDAVYEKLRETKNITFLVNNAGYGIPGSFIENDLTKQIDMINVHNIASFQLCKAVLPQMVERNTGTIINVSSISGLIVKYGNVTYTATKAFLITLSEALQEELKHTNIKIQALCPGMTESGFHDTKELERFDKTSVPKKFWMSSNEVAQKSLEALSKKKTIYVPGFRNRLIVTLSNSKIFGKIIKSLVKRKLSKKK